MKRGWTFHLGVSSIVLACCALFLTYVWLAPSTHPYVIKEQEGSLVNPVFDLTDSQALAGFNSKYIFFLLYYTKAYQLHTRPLSTDTPRLLIVVDGVTYRAEVVRGIITVSKGTYSDPDITLYSTREEVIRLLRTPSEIRTSFASGISKVETHASRATLFSKGYLRLYDSLFPSTITGNVIRIAWS